MDFAAIDYLGRPIENPTIQIDVESGERFGITYIDQEEKEHHPIILHCSPTGSIERVICSLLEKSAIEHEGKTTNVPVWLAPIQVRVIPIAERHMEFAFRIWQKNSEMLISGLMWMTDQRLWVRKSETAGGEWASIRGCGRRLRTRRF